LCFQVTSNLNGVRKTQTPINIISGVQAHDEREIIPNLLTRGSEHFPSKAQLVIKRTAVFILAAIGMQRGKRVDEITVVITSRFVSIKLPKEMVAASILLFLLVSPIQAP
jgi:hypothetical protein